MTHETKGQNMAINTGMLDFADKLNGEYTLDLSSAEAAVEHIRHLLIRDAVPHEDRGDATHIYTGDVSTYLVKRTPQPGKNNAVEVRIVSVIAGVGTIPVGEYVTVSRSRLVGV